MRFACRRLIVPLAVLAVVVAPHSATAELMPLSVNETPTSLDVVIRWTEAGTEPTYVVPSLENWILRLRITDRRPAADEWLVDIDVFHQVNVHAGIETSSFGGLQGTFAMSSEGTVLLLDTAILHHFPPVPMEGESPVFGPPPIDHLVLEVQRTLAIPQPLSTIRVTAQHDDWPYVPEPGTNALTAGLLIVFATYWRHARSRQRTARGGVVALRDGCSHLVQENQYVSNSRSLGNSPEQEP